ncbi:nucleotidyltransferase domain protein [Geobacillus kaustophilus]|uniref:Nucleotidyltransferase domain protein n=1 Tax=Geobacillus kaustophilus TaxID=1462 RepID=A0A0D8BSI5_GEOKU|nr:nucleotidyltransferase domain-containing protein [Geobacillus kaustophilus]KJE27126.1 nucleotidyltransferase domain protein [Geobacillus kaustophilus]
MPNEMEMAIIQTLRPALHPFAIYLFGSAAFGALRPDSDIDIAFVSDGKPHDPYELFRLAGELAGKLGRDVDLVDLRQANTVFQAQVVSSGKVIDCGDERKRAEFEMRTLKMYAKLNEERAPVLKRIAESGSVYET